MILDFTFIRNRKFDSDQWKRKDFRLRKYLIKELLKRDLLIGKTKEEIEEFLGVDNNYFDNDQWHYFLYSDWWSQKKYYLMIDFSNSKVIRVRVIFKRKQKGKVVIK